METVSARMTSPYLSIEQDESIKNAAKKIYDLGIGSLLVTHNKHLVGIITKTDLMIKVIAENLDTDSTLVANIMSQPIISIDAGEPLDSAREILREKSIRHLAVNQNNQIVGVLSIKDLG
jgi:signal-transduction protein with cAMP-binding, CBS, and nucleotidyltransferase domain